MGKYLKVGLKRDSSLVELNPRLLTLLCLWILVLPVQAASDRPSGIPDEGFELAKFEGLPLRE